MSILKPESLLAAAGGAALGAAPSRAQETALIARLANELFSGIAATPAGGSSPAQGAALLSPAAPAVAAGGVAPSAVSGG